LICSDLRSSAVICGVKADRQCLRPVAELDPWALELGQAVSRPDPKELGLVRVQFLSVDGHPAADVDNAVCHQ